MLHYYSFSNYQSFREHTKVSLVLGKKTPVHSWERTAISGERLSTALAVFGANAAGKTALLKPLAFVSWFISSSFSHGAEEPILFTPHFACEGSPLEIEIEAEDAKGDLWRYELTATTKRVIREALYKKQKRYSYVFIRDWNESSRSYEIKQQGFGFAPAEARKVRPNASLISTAAQYGVEIAQYLAGYSSVATNITFFGRQKFQTGHMSYASELFANNDSLQKRMIKLLKRWDLGLSDVRSRSIEVQKRDGSSEKKWMSFGVHQTRDGVSAELPMDLESSGTQSAFVLLSRLLVVLDQGGVALIDEMESDLHPNLVEPVLELFADEKTNPNGAQIIFTCHSTKVLDILSKAQVMFVQKNECESEAYRGDDIQGLRSDDNLRAKYEAGALSAVPRV
jgi:uncharacterized protein